MTDRKKDEPIIELTEVIEEGPSSAAGEWMETTPPPPPEKKIAEPPKVAKKVSPINVDDLKGIPDSPLKKFLLAEEEPTPPAGPPMGGKPLGFSQPAPQPSPPRLPNPPDVRQSLRERSLSRHRLPPSLLGLLFLTLRLKCGPSGKRCWPE